jgi:hypothetical protein
MRILLLFLLFVLVGFSLVGGYRYVMSMQQGSSKIVPVITTNFSLKKAPSESLRGTIASMSGTVQWLSRTANKPVRVTAPRSIQQGESLSTGKNGRAIVLIKNDSLISLAPDTALTFIQLLPVNFVIGQEKGTVTYTNSMQVPISVKSFDFLMIIDNGVGQIATNDKEKTVTLTVTKGSVNAGFEDEQNNNTVVTINAGEKYVFDEKTREGTMIQLPGFVAPVSLPFGH